MSSAAAPTRAPKSAHVIDLRQSGSGGDKPRPSHKPAPKPAHKAVAIRKPHIKPSVAPQPQPAPKVAPTEPAELESAELPAPEAEAPVAATTQPISASYLDAPPQRRFWSAFWRFLLLLVIFGVLLIGGVYLYLKYYT
jgi:hypothetical protein